MTRCSGHAILRGAALALALTWGGAGLSRAADAPVPVMAPAARFVPILATPETLARLRSGGFVLYLRHGHTDSTRSDRLPAVDLDDCSTQRPLTEAGRLMSARVGEAMRQAQIPLGEIRTSPLCRARETALAAFPDQPLILDPELIYTANFTDAQKAPIIAHIRALLSAPVPPGHNRLLVGHAPNLMDLMNYFPKESTLVIFRPMGGTDFEYIASIPLGSWPNLLK
jgi:phosphohistidine phosphatase SixA